MKYIKECLWNSLQNFHREFHSISIFSHDIKIPWKILMTMKLSIMCYDCFMVISRNFHETTQVVIYSQKKQNLRSSRAGQSITMEFSFNWQNLISTIPLSACADPKSQGHCWRVTSQGLYNYVTYSLSQYYTILNSKDLLVTSCGPANCVH